MPPARQSRNTRDAHDEKDDVAAKPEVPPWVWIVFTLIYLITVPWYLSRDWIDPTFWAFPAWSAVMVAGTIALAAFNAYVFLRHWPDDNEDGGVEDGQASRDIE